MNAEDFIRLEIRCDLLGPPICSVFSMVTETMNRNCVEGMKRQALFHHSQEFQDLTIMGTIPLVGISFGSKVGYR